MRHIFFSFHYDDVWRCNQVRNCWVGSGKLATGFVDQADFEKIQRRGSVAVERWIDEQMDGASVTVVLIGTKTAERPYVHYEIEKSRSMKMGMIGIHINRLKDQLGKSKPSLGEVPYLLKSGGYKVYNAPNVAKIRDNIGDWVETAAKDVGR